MKCKSVKNLLPLQGLWVLLLLLVQTRKHFFPVREILLEDGFNNMCNLIMTSVLYTKIFAAKEDDVVYGFCDKSLSAVIKAEKYVQS